MIVKDKAASILKASEISANIIKLISKDTERFDCDDDPAEQVYLICHIIGILFAKVCVSLNGYSKVYGIEKLDAKAIKEWINLIADENLKVNRNET